MTNRQLRVVIIYMLMFGLCTFATGRYIGAEQQISKYEELQDKYNILEIQYKRDLESCYQQIGDMQDDPDVNNDGVVNSLDLLVLQQYILNQDNG